jgi:TBC1 domain family member 14
MSFAVLNNLTQHPLLSALFSMNVSLLVQHLRIFEILFARRLPRVYENFRRLGSSSPSTLPTNLNYNTDDVTIGITSDQYAMEWFMTLFSRALPLEISHHLWDCFIMEGEMFLYRAAVGMLTILLVLFTRWCNGNVGILKMEQKELEIGSFDECMALVKNFKDVDEARLFRKIFSVRVPKHLIGISERLKNSHVLLAAG